MKKILIIALCFVYYHTQAQNPNGKTDKELWYFNGQIKTVREKCYEPKVVGSKIVKGSPKRNFLSNYYFVYKKNNYWKSRTYYRNGIVNKKDVYEYNDKDKKSKMLEYYKRKLSWKTIYYYDKSERCIGHRKLKSSGEYSSKESYTYYPDGRIKEIKYFGKDSLKYYNRHEFKYDDNNKIIEETTFEKTGKISNKSTKKLNKKGLVISVKDDAMSGGKYNSEVLYIYNEHGHKKKYIFRWENNAPDIYTYKYIYDTKGNWIVCIEYKNDTAEQYFERTYTYYQLVNKQIY